MGCCETLTGIVKDCDSKVGGVKKFWITCLDYTNGIDLAITNNQVTGDLGINADNSAWKSYAVNLDTSYVTQTLVQDKTVGNRYWDTEVFMQFAHLTLEKQNEIAALTKSQVWIIVQDRNNDYWLLGDTGNSVYATAATIQTGTSITDLNGYTITWSYQSKIPMYPVSPSAIKPTPDTTCTLQWSDFVCQTTSPNAEIKPTNKTDGVFRCAALGQDGKLYFGGNGIWYLDNDGEIKPTNKTDSNFQYAALGQDGKLYFADNYNNGIWYLEDGEIKPTRDTQRSYYCVLLGQDGILYLGSNDNTGIWYLENGQIQRTNTKYGNYYGGLLSPDGKLYFLGYNNNGICFLEDGEIKSTNKTNGAYNCASKAQDGKLYFGGNSNNGIWYLEDAEIKSTNKIDGNFHCAALGQDNKLYFGGYYNNGIWYLDNDGTIKPTNKTDGNFHCTSLGQDGKLYFGCEINNGIWYLDNDGEIKPTNKTNGYFYCAALGQDGKLYFGSNNNNGILYLDVSESENTGTAIAKTLTYKKYENGKPTQSVVKNILTDVTPIINEEQYQFLSNGEVQQRADQLVSTLNICNNYEQINSPIDENSALCAQPEITCTLEWSDYICQTKTLIDNKPYYDTNSDNWSIDEDNTTTAYGTFRTPYPVTSVVHAELFDGILVTYEDGVIHSFVAGPPPSFATNISFNIGENEAHGEVVIYNWQNPRPDVKIEKIEIEISSPNLFTSYPMYDDTYNYFLDSPIINTDTALAKTLTYKKYKNGTEVETITKNILADIEPVYSQDEYATKTIDEIQRRAVALIDSVNTCQNTQTINHVHITDGLICPKPLSNG